MLGATAAPVRTLVVACEGSTAHPRRRTDDLEVTGVLARFTPELEVTRPGRYAMAVRGPARYFGGEVTLAERVREAVDQVLSDARCRVGIADGVLAAELAAARDTIVAPGATAAFLSEMPVGILGLPELSHLLGQLGIRCLGDLADLDEQAVTERFGLVGITAHRFARGLADRALEPAPPPVELAQQIAFEPPLDEGAAVAFAVAPLAEALVAEVRSLGLDLTAVAVELDHEPGAGSGSWPGAGSPAGSPAGSSAGSPAASATSRPATRTRRCWRADRPFGARAIVDRVRWQLDGAALAGGLRGVTSCRLVAVEVAPHRDRQGTFVGGESDLDRRARRGLARVQGLLGHDAVLQATTASGRGFTDRVCLTPFGDLRPLTTTAKAPWPGQLPLPAPALVYAQPIAIELLDASGHLVVVSGRGLSSAAPASLWIGGRMLAVVGWAGPWPLDERWWDPAGHRRRARFQILLEDGGAHLVVLEGGRWGIEASYD